MSFLRHDDDSGSWLPMVCVRKTKGPLTMWILAPFVSSNSNDEVGLDRNTVAWTDADADRKIIASSLVMQNFNRTVNKNLPVADGTDTGTVYTVTVQPYIRQRCTALLSVVIQIKTQ